MSKRKDRLMEDAESDSEMRTAAGQAKDYTSMNVGTSSSKLESQRYAYEPLNSAYLNHIKQFADKATPFVNLCCAKWKDLVKITEPYKLNLLLPSLLGLIMCFFGGAFYMLIAAVEAYRLVGYEETQECIKHLRTDFENVLKENSKDNERDDNEDGIPDVEQISSSEYTTRKTFLFFRTIDPKRVTEALTGLAAGFMSVIATLKIQFAQSVTLGHAIGATIEKPILKALSPRLHSFLPEQQKKWTKHVISYTVKFGCITVAFIMQRIISAFHSAIRGGLMFSRNILKYLSTMNYLHINHEDTYLDEIVGGTVAVIGLYWQLRAAFTLPWFFVFLLFPAVFLEWILEWLVGGM